MKHVLTAFLAFSFLFSACQKGVSTTNYANTGRILGPDLSNMVCAQGYIITMDSDMPTVQDFVDPLPADCGIDLKGATFPIKVRFNYHVKPDPNPCKFIVIDAIQKVD